MCRYESIILICSVIAAKVQQLEYRTLERIRLSKPVDRLAFISDRCRGKHVLDIGCLDETALQKRETDHWLHRRIAAVADDVLGVDSSDLLDEGTISTAPNARIVKGDALDLELSADAARNIDIIVAGEFIEHLESPLAFMRSMKRQFPGKTMLLSTPNGVSLANGLLATIGREAQHHDHLLTSTYKTLNTLCIRAGVRHWRILPYRFYATEMLLSASGPMKLATALVEKTIRVAEYIFPLRAFGYIVEITL